MQMYISKCQWCSFVRKYFTIFGAKRKYGHQQTIRLGRVSKTVTKFFISWLLMYRIRFNVLDKFQIYFLVSNSKYGHQRTNSTIGSNRPLVGSWNCWLHFMNVFIRRILQQIMIYFWDKFHIYFWDMRGNWRFKKLVFRKLSGKMEIYVYIAYIYILI